LSSIAQPTLSSPPFERLSFECTASGFLIVDLECPRFGGHLIAWSALSGWAGRMARYAKGIELQEAVHVGVPA
jgi:hypothetical protein